MPKVSPNKTWVGTVAGLLGSMFLMVVFYQFNYFSDKLTLLDLLSLGFIGGFFGQLGDFSESLLKREANIKDTSQLLRGHGGILDRFDSLAFAAPIAYIYFNFCFHG